MTKRPTSIVFYRIASITFLVITTCKAYSLTYKEKYADVLKHYQQTILDARKYEAALFLIEHMDGLQSPEGTGITNFCQRIRDFKPRTDIGKLSKAWRDCHVKGMTKMCTDSSIVSSEYLISNIDEAFDAWEHSPWEKDVTFQMFCEYILPYKVSDEHINSQWRCHLRAIYQSKIEGVNDIKSAFAIIKKEVMKKVKSSSSFTPYNLDALAYEHIQRANCDQRCILLVSVLRALAIPAVVDAVPCWADYSTLGHSWVALVLEGGATYTINKEDEYPKRYNKIDASEFLTDISFLDTISCPYQIKTRKKVAKVYRKVYGQKMLDVSSEYGLDGNLKIPCTGKDEVYLCTFLTGKGWNPVALAQIDNGIADFQHLGKGIVYLPTIIKSGKHEPLSTPILLDEDGTKRPFPMAGSDTCTIIASRKYPLCAYMPSQWIKLISGVFESSTTSTFEHPDTIAFITSMPYGKTIIPVDKTKMHRYVRFKSPQREIALLSELSFLSEDGNPIQGRYMSEQVDTNSILLLFDDNTETKLKAYKPGYWVGIDLGQIAPETLTHISFSPVSDGNDIQKNHLYELYGYDTTWKILGRCYARQPNPLIFHDVPKGMLMLLKDKTKGREERIFAIVNNQTLWY